MSPLDDYRYILDEDQIEDQVDDRPNTFWHDGTTESKINLTVLIVLTFFGALFFIWMCGHAGRLAGGFP